MRGESRTYACTHAVNAPDGARTPCCSPASFRTSEAVRSRLRSLPAVVIFLYIFAGSGLAEAAATPVPDDTALHIAAGVGTAMVAGGAAALALRPWNNCGGAYFCEMRPTWEGAFGVAAISTGASLAVGGAKELADMLGFGTPSFIDVTWTVLGGLTGAVASSYFLATYGHDSNARTVATGSAAAGLVFAIPVQRGLLDRLR